MFRTSLIALGLVLFGCKKAEPVAAPATAPSAKAEPAKAATSAAVPEGVAKMLGRWMRLDGGYVLELRNPDISGKLEAGYFNPKSINVSRAIWMQGSGGLQVAVELNDVGYPGATYVLSHDAQGDRLVGQYSQPQMQQTFDVEFVRQKAPPLR
ncbi:MAG TPA: hypothetical protein VGE76_08690 [Opitutaceae bacterium]